MEQMKTKRFALLLACVLCTTIVVLLYGDPSVQPSIQNLVTETHSRFTSWKSLHVQEVRFILEYSFKFVKGINNLNNNQEKVQIKRLFSEYLNHLLIYFCVICVLLVTFKFLM